MAAANALFNTLGVPGEIVVYHKGAELEVDAFGGGFGGDHDCGLVTKPVNYGLAFVGTA